MHIIINYEFLVRIQYIMSRGFRLLWKDRINYFQIIYSIMHFRCAFFHFTHSFLINIYNITRSLWQNKLCFKHIKENIQLTTASMYARISMVWGLEYNKQKKIFLIMNIILEIKFWYLKVIINFIIFFVL